MAARYFVAMITALTHDCKIVWCVASCTYSDVLCPTHVMQNKSISLQDGDRRKKAGNIGYAVLLMTEVTNHLSL